MLERINEAKERLASIMGNRELNDEEVLETSRELDLLILEYYKDMEIYYEENM